MKYEEARNEANCLVRKAMYLPVEVANEKNWTINIYIVTLFFK
jgi:hypothetical protein